MDVRGWLILLIILLCITAALLAHLIFRAKKRKETEALASTEDEAKADEWLERLVAFQTDQEKASKQITIYAFNSQGQKCLCPLCDGENEMSAIYCQICGQKLSRGGE